MTKPFSVLLSVVLCSVICAPTVAQEVDQSPLPVKVVRAFPELKPRRPVVITNAGDGSNRLFVCTEQGVIHALASDQNATETQTFLDIEERVSYKDKENEEGLLGLAFHPKFKTNGEFFVYYTSLAKPHTSIISRFRVSKNDPSQGDPASEEVLLEIPQPFWNHNGGNLLFGPDGYLYIALGDGGSADDPLKNGQNLSTLLGSILRIDVDHQDSGKAYAIPKDNPFVNTPGAQPEIYAYGVRNIWGISYDVATGLLWAADVGQNLWEEIDLIVKGGNYGWSQREAMHKFGPNGAERNADMIEPIWMYHHDIGKSITGGHVYRGKLVPELVGYYVYADYVSGRVWGLKYDAKAKSVVANRQIESRSNPYMAIGRDEQGETYLSDSFGYLWRFESAGK
jgi:quinoprotein glucose dehydrogenase